MAWTVKNTSFGWTGLTPPGCFAKYSCCKENHTLDHCILV